MNKKIYLKAFLLTIVMIISQTNNGFTQNSDRNKDERVTLVIMENVLFQGIVASNELDLLNKKIARVDEMVSDPNDMYTDADLENRRLQLYASLRNRLVFEKKKLTSKK